LFVSSSIAIVVSVCFKPSKFLLLLLLLAQDPVKLISTSRFSGEARRFYSKSVNSSLN